MKSIPVERLIEMLDGKDLVHLNELVQIIEDEFDVNVQIERPLRAAELEDSIPNDPDLIRQVRASEEDFHAGRVYSAAEGLEYLRKQMRESARGSDF